MNLPAERIPIILLTGFLGSGKTTLLRSALRGDEGAATAVLVNELGAIGLDHHLLWTSTGTVSLLENGCVCCAIRDDLVSCLEDLFWNRLRRKLPRFRRVVVEMTGLADPRHIVDALGRGGLVRERYRLAAVVAAVDARAALEQHARHPEWLAQVAMADTLLLTKTEVADRSATVAVRELLWKVNPIALVHDALGGAVAPELVLDELPSSGWRRDAGPPPSLFRAEAVGAPHDPQVGTILVRLVGPTDLGRLAGALREAAARFCDRLLRVKGVIKAPGGAGPMIVQAVGKDVSEPEEAKDWRGPVGWLVLIGMGVPREEAEEIFAGLSASVGSQ